MSPCEDKELLLQGMLDGELDAVNTLACETHLRECAACAEEFERLRALRQRLRTPGVAFGAPAGLRMRVLQELARAEGRVGDESQASLGAADTPATGARGQLIGSAIAFGAGLGAPNPHVGGTTDVPTSTV